MGFCLLGSIEIRNYYNIAILFGGKRIILPTYTYIQTRSQIRICFVNNVRYKKNTKLISSDIQKNKLMNF